MEATTHKQNSRARGTREIVKIAHSKEAVVAIPVIIHPVEVEVPLRAIPVEIGDVPIAINERLGAIVCTIIRTTTPRVHHGEYFIFLKRSTAKKNWSLSGLNLICDLMYLFAQ